jgi:outer membrane receptor protein involved in Fe transport
LNRNQKQIAAAMKKLILSLVLLSTGKILSAQSIKGTITDSKTHQPLSYSTVSLLKVADSSQLKGALANDNGLYKLENIKTGNYLLSAQIVGYVKKLVPVTVIKDEINVNMDLTPQTNQLSEVTIKATKPLIERHTDKMVFNVENSIVAAGNNGMELLKMAPLVTLSQDNTIKLKGKENVMVMLDGKIIPGETAGSLLQSMSAEQISKIEIITNPSAKYDASATGGIINIITKKGTGMGLNGTANLSASRSDYGKYNGGVSLNYRTNKLNIYGNLNLRDGKGYRNEGLIRYLQTAGQPITLETPTELFTNGKAETGKVGIDYTLNKTSTIGFSAEGLFLQSDNRANATSYFRDAAGTLDSVLTSASRPCRNNNYTSYDLNYSNKINAKGEEITIDLNQSHFAGLTKQDLDAQMIAVSTNRPAEYSSSVNRTNSLFNITTFQTDYTLPLDTSITLETGVKNLHTSSANRSSNQDVNSLTGAPDFSNTSYKENIAAGYLILTQQLKTLKLQGGVRAEQTNASLSNTNLNTNYLNFFPSAVVDKKFSDKYELTFTYAGKINRPAYQSLIPFVVPIDRYTREKGNPDLKPEYAHSFELTNNIHDISITLGYTYTHNAITDFIEQDQQTKVWTFTKGNFNHLENYNVAVVLPYNPTHWWNSNNTVVGLYNSYYGDNVGGSIYDHGKFSYDLNSINTFTLPNNIKAELTAIYNSNSINGLYQISHYSMVNAGVSKAFLAKMLNVKLGVNDIFKGSGYTLSSNAGSLHMNGHSYSDSRRVTLSLSYKFGKKVTQARQSNHDDVKGRLSL